VIIPSIDLMGGQTVQLVGGKDKALDAGDPLPIAKRFGLAGEVAVIDLDAALGKGTNRALIDPLLGVARCRVGGGIRDATTARAWLDRGAEKVILGTRAVPEVLKELPKDRVIAALDTAKGEVVVEGWTQGTGRTVLDRIAELRDLVGGFLVTFVDKEGRLGGTELGAVQELVKAARGARVTIAGGVTTAEEVGELDRLGADAQVGMAIYTGRLSLGAAIAAPIRSPGPWPTVVLDARDIALGFGTSDPATLERALGEGRAHTLEGDFSGAELLGVDLDSRRTALFMRTRGAPARQFGRPRGLDALEHTLLSRKSTAVAGSYTRRLLEDPELLAAKLAEEAAELAQASSPEHVAAETADLVYFALVAMIRGGASLAEVEAVLDRRALKLDRRPGDAKAPPREGSSGGGS
jgi:phosphoribosyl-ATP pyrophosphohydrolase